MYMGLISGRKVLLLQFRGDEFTRDFERRAVLRASGLPADTLTCHDLYGTSAPSHIVEGFRAVIIGGSKCSVFEEHPGMGALVGAVRHAHSNRIPIFGICFGAQVLTHFFGGSVIRDVQHREKGTYDMELLPTASGDPLFSAMPGKFAAQCSHQDQIVTLPVGATALVRSEDCPVQAFVMPGAAYGIQFHPERSKSDFEELASRWIGDYDETEHSGSDYFLRPLRESPEAESLVSGFVETALDLSIERVSGR
jgi:GMP synthase-like glutamine amidotransferase